MRIVALSDQHGYLPEIQPCDLLIVAGDVCPDLIGQSAAKQHPEQERAWFDDHARPWLAASPAAQTYAAVPEGIDVLVSHGPPYGYGDRAADEQSGTLESLGSRELLAAITRVKPRLVICGHVHEGYGCFEYEGTLIYNVAVVNEQYRLVRRPTVIDIADW